jgi:hypothetical protein
MQPQDDPDHVEAGTSLWHAIRIIVIADLIMSFDNIVAVAAVAKGDFVLMALGLAVSIPIVIYGAALLIRLLNRFPVVVPGAAALIGFVGGEIMLDDPAWSDWLAQHAAWAPDVVPLVSAVLVVLAGRVIGQPATSPSAAAVADEATEIAALVGLRALGRVVLTRAPVIVAFIASALGYSQGAPVDGAVAGSALSAVRPIFGAVLAIVIAEALARLVRRPQSPASP